MIAQVILWTNGLVQVFDSQGEQMPEFQGEYGEVRNKICAVYSGAWMLGQWGEGILAHFHPFEVSPPAPTGKIVTSQFHSIG